MKQKLSFHRGWLFHEGEIAVEEAMTKSPLYIEAKTERKRCGPAAKAYLDGAEHYDDSGLISHETWTEVTLPHDYIIAQEPRKEYNQALGFFRYQNAWYRKHFTLDTADDGKRVTLLFEGVAIHCTVYVNGCRMLENRCGYTSFEVDISDVAVFGGENVVAVHIDTSEHEGWWYEGAGIYRPVWLIRAETVSVDLYGVFVHPEKKGEEWPTIVDTTLRNDGYVEKTAQVRSAVIDPQGREIACSQESLRLPPRKRTTLRQICKVSAPVLWSVDTPVLYTLATVVTVDGEVVERQENRFGYRTAEFRAGEGFFLNGIRTQINGVCCHQDFGFTGKAVPERVQRYRLQLLKEMGANGYRCAHYPHHACTMDLLDELGFLVMAETRWFESTPEGMAQLEMLIKRDRNHPSVVLWSAGNEEPLHAAPAGARIARAMLHRIRELDGTRSVTTAVSHSPAQASVQAFCDVAGVNYNLPDLDALREKYPDKPLLSTECAATGTTRGWYFGDCPERGYCDGYDKDTNRTFLARENTYKFISARPWIAGSYQWAGIEHRGEAVWPRVCSQSGAIDLFLQKKDAFYQNRSHWTKTPMVHILPHWNWIGMEGMPLRVSVYTNCEEVCLWRNGESFGAKAVEKGGHAEWQVPFAPGEIKAVGSVNGCPVCEETVKTTGRPVRLRLRAHWDAIRADGEDVALLTCDCLDAQGMPVPDAAPFVRFHTNGLGRIAGTGSDISDHVPVTCPDRRMRAGLISVLVRSGTKEGRMAVFAEAEGLAPAAAFIDVK